MAARKTPAKPEPIPVDTVCSVCNLGWSLHGNNPTTDDCIRLLKQEVINAELRRPISVPYRPLHPYREPYFREPYFWYNRSQPVNICCSTAQNEASHAKSTFESNMVSLTPASGSLTCSAL